MIAHVPATTSRPPRELAEPTGDHEAGAPGWPVRLVRIGLAIYLIPVLLVVFLVGGLGAAVLGVAAAVARLASLARTALGSRRSDFPL